MSGVESRPVPINILEWPRIRDLIMQQKFIYTELYYNPNSSSCGCYLYGVEASAARLGMTAGSLEDALQEFERRHLIACDRSTGEVFVVDWPRWHLYKTPAAFGALTASINKIQSEKLRAHVKKAYESTLQGWKEKDKGKDKGKASSANAEEERTPHPTSGPPPSSSISGKGKKIKQPFRSPTGIFCWNDGDFELATEIERQYSADEIELAVSQFPDPQRALPSRVAAKIEEMRALESEAKRRRDLKNAEDSSSAKREREDERRELTKSLFNSLSQEKRIEYAKRFMVEHAMADNRFDPVACKFRDPQDQLACKSWILPQLTAPQSNP